jgi:hypothetical protein
MRKKQCGGDYPISGGGAMGLYCKGSSVSRYFAYAVGICFKKTVGEKY